MTSTGHDSRPPRRARRVTAAVLVGLFAIMLPVAITAAWVRTTILSTGGYVAAVGPLAADPAVRAVVKTAASEEIGPALSRAADSALPPGLSFVTGPLGNGLGNLASDAVNQVMAGQEFQRLWQAANTTAHSQLIGVLNGHSSAVAATGNHVVLNLTPMVNVVLKQAAARLSSMTGKTIKAPVISQLPAGACQQAARLAHAALPADCGQIPLFPATALTGARRAFGLLNQATLALLFLTPAVGAAALLVSPRRRRTLLALSVAASTTVLAVTAALTWGQSNLASKEPAAYRPAVNAVVQAVTGEFFNLAWWHIAVGLALTAALALAACRRGTGSAIHSAARRVRIAR